MRREVARFSPDDVPRYERFIKKSEEIFRIGFSELAHLPFDKPLDMARIVPAMVRLESYRTVYNLVSKYIKHEKLRQVFSFHPLLVGGNPFNITSIYTLILYLERFWGVHYAMGGTGVLVQGLVRLIEGLGGSVRLGAEVEEIEVQGVRPPAFA
jgi:phytoene desaturase